MASREASRRFHAMQRIMGGRMGTQISRSVRESLNIQMGMLRWIVAALLTFAFVAPTYAGALHVIVNCATSTQGGGSEACTQKFEQSPGTLTPGAPVSTALSGSDPSSSFSTNATARADYGSLGISAAASLHNSASSENLETRTASVVANAFSHWDDQVTISGTPGTLATVRIDYVVDIHSLDTSANGSAAGYGRISLNSTGQPDGKIWCLAVGSGVDNPSCGQSGTYTPLTVGTNLITFSMQMVVGESIHWVVDLQGDASAIRPGVFDPTAGDASASLDALNTVESYFTVLTPGATMQWASGHDYSVPLAAAAPAPATLALLGLALAGLGWSRRKK